MTASNSKKLTREEFASLLTVGITCAVREPPAVIPTDPPDRARLHGGPPRQAADDYARQAADSGGI